MLKREITQWDLILLMINCIIGAGIYGLPSKIYSQSSAYSIIAIPVCAILMMIIILNFAEVASRFKETGGPYLYSLKAFGNLTGYIIGWLALISRIAAYAALINLLLDYLSYLNEGFNIQSVRTISIILISTFLFFINYKGVKNSARLNNILALAKLVPLTLFIIIGCFYINPDLIDFTGDVPGTADFSTTLLILVFAFTGFEAAVINSGEMVNPQRDIPFALIITTIFVTIFYTLIQFVSIGTYPELASSNRPVADTAKYILGDTAGLFIMIGGIISISGTLNANLLAGSRLPFALSEEGQFPKLFLKTNPRTAIPLPSLILYTLATILVSVTGTFIYALTINVISKVFIFAIISAALIKFRKLQPASRPAFKLKFGYLSAISGIIICIFLLYSSEIQDFIAVLFAIFIGLIFYFINQYFKSKQSFRG